MEALTFIGFTVVFLVEMALAATHLPEIPPYLLVALGVAAYRGGRAISFNEIFKWLRDLFGVAETPDSSGAGNSNNPTGTGVMRVIGALLCCPICSGTHTASALMLLLSVWYEFGLALIYGLAAAGIAELQPR